MKEKLLIRLSALNFGMIETRLFLDTHPDNAEATELFNKYHKQYRELKCEFEEKYGPLTLNGSNSDEWIKDPWPWDNEFNTKSSK